MKEKVIFDTNFLYNKKGTSFFGNREDLKKFTIDADILIPEVVIEELMAKYERDFEQEKEKFLKTILPSIIDHNTNEVNIKSKLNELIDTEAIAYTKILLTDFSVLPKIKKLAIGKLPPFENRDDTDKGFKDAYVYFTILEFLQKSSDKYVFVCTKDKRFKMAFDKHPNIRPIESHDEFKKYSILQFFDDYFIQKINEVLEFTISKENIIEYWHNVDGNQNILIKTDDVEYVLEVDSNEIVDSAKVEDYQDLIQQLINSGDFQRTHNSVAGLKLYIKYLSDEEIVRILNSSCNNEQIKWIIEDEDVKEFIGALYKAKSVLIENDVAEFLMEKFK